MVSIRSLSIRRIFLRGLIVLIPIIVTIYVIAAIIQAAEATFGAPLRATLPEDYYFPGMGVAAAVVLIFAFGLLLYAWFVRSFVRMAERGLESVPLVKSLYAAMSDLLSYIRESRTQDHSQVVLIRMSPHMQLLGLVTREDISDVTHEGPGEDDRQRMIAVYMPMSYQIGGYTVFIPRAAVKPIDMPFEDAMRFILTGGAGGNQKLIEYELRGIEEELEPHEGKEEQRGETGESSSGAASPKTNVAAVEPTSDDDPSQVRPPIAVPTPQRNESPGSTDRPSRDSH